MAERKKTVIVKNLEKRFDSFVAVDHISLEVAAGEIFGFLGPNGAGKSTTIRMLCGILAPSGGTATVGGFDIRSEPEKVKASIGYMSQKFSLYEDLSVEENIDFYSGIYRLPAEKKKERKEWVLHMSGLRAHRSDRTGTLSGGWKQRLALGCAIIHEPPIIFLDEPTSGVDPISRRRFWDLIYELAGRGVTAFVTTHYMDEAEYCDRLGLMYGGRLIAGGSPNELKTDLMREDVFELTCPDAPEVMENIEGLASVRSAALFGRAMHVIAEPGRGPEAESDMRRFLQERKIPGRVERIVPSLEDVFVSLIEAAEERQSENPQ